MCRLIRFFLFYRVAKFAFFIGSFFSFFVWTTSAFVLRSRVWSARRRAWFVSAALLFFVSSVAAPSDIKCSVYDLIFVIIGVCDLYPISFWLYKMGIGLQYPFCTRDVYPIHFWRAKKILGNTIRFARNTKKITLLHCCFRVFFMLACFRSNLI